MHNAILVWEHILRNEDDFNRQKGAWSVRNNALGGLFYS